MQRDLTKRLKSLPDLSFYPENHLVRHALSNPIAFGQQAKAEISDLIDIADLSLQRFDDASERLGQELESENPWHRYWAATVCSTFGEQASGLAARVRPLLKDENLMVRLRACEFLGLIHAEDPFPGFSSILQISDDPVVNSLVLNSWVFFRDHTDEYQAEFVDRMKVKNDEVKRRVEYLSR